MDSLAVPLSREDLEQELQSRTGLIPVSLDSVSRRIVWTDVEQFHFYDGLFDDGLRMWNSIRNSPPKSFTTSLDVLDSVRIPPPLLSPGCFIFHAARCGSTLLAQVLARSRENMVFAEAGPHNRIWDTATGVTACRNLFLAMGRRRLLSYRSHIVKFTSFNILRFQRIRETFPSVPALFLFRDPSAMLNSYRRSPPSWMRSGQETGKDLSTPETAIEAFFRAALAIGDPDFRCLNYADLTPKSIASVLQFLRLETGPRELGLMTGGFLWDASNRGNSRSFAPRRPAPLSQDQKTAVPDTLQELYSRLRVWKPVL